MAETRTIRTVLELNAQRFNAGAASAAASAKSLAGELGKIGDATGAQRANYDRVSNSLLGVGTAAAAGLGLAAKASMDWESAWAGVLKTVDGTDAELAAVEEGLRGLTKVLPASHQEIAAVAEAAGQLGVETGSVVEFTETMINLGETTNLSAEEAATGLARFSNIMGTSQDDVDRLGAALVGLGNNYATTEGEILAMSMRLAGTGAQMNLTEGDVMGLATAMSSVGIEAEAGGTAMSMGMRKIDAAVREGGDSLAGFAEVAGMTNDEFARLWSDDSAQGLDAFVQGLARVSAEGGDVSGVLSDLGIKGIRESDTFLRLAGAADILGDALADGNTEFERNLALTEEATKRYQTTESQLQLARNAIVDAGIDIGASVLPVLADVAAGVADVASWFAALPEPVQSAVTGLGGIVATTGLVAGGLMRIVPAATETVSSFRNLRTTSPQVASALTRVGKAVGVATVAFGAVSAIAAYGDSLTDFSIGANEAAEAAMRMGEAGNPFETVFSGMGEDAYLASAGAEELARDLDVLANGHWKKGLSDAETNVRNFFGAGLATTEEFSQRLEAVGQGLAGLAETDLTAAQESFTALWEAAGGTDAAGADLLELMPAYEDALRGMAMGADLATDDQTLLKIATGELVPVVDEATGAVTGYDVAQGDAEGATDDTTGAVEEQVGALAELQDMLEETANLLLGVRGSERDFRDSVRDATEAVKENGKVLDEGTEAADANQAALDGVAEATHNWANEADEANASAEELDQIMRDGREAFIDAAIAMGKPREEAEKLADELQLIPTFVETKVQIESEAAQEEWDRVYAELWPDGGHPPLVLPVETEYEEGDPLFTGGVLLDPATMPVEADTTPAEGDVNTFVEGVDDETGEVRVSANIRPAFVDIMDLEAAIEDSGGTVEINGETYNADTALAELMNIINYSGGTVTIDGQSYPADEALAIAIAAINDGKGTVDILGDNSDANAKTNAAKAHADNTEGEIDVDADTAEANRKINSAARDRTTTITVSTVGVQSTITSGRLRGQSALADGGWVGRADGGWIGPGLSQGGWVPGPYPGKGIDNVMWPSLAGAANGRMLDQPLAGTEYVVNGASAQQWGPALEAMNSGITPAQMAALVAPRAAGAGLSLTQQISGLNAYEVARESTTQMRHVVREQAIQLTGG